MLFSSCNNSVKNTDENSQSRQQKSEMTKNKPVDYEATKVDTIKGIDVSHFQGEVDWSDVKTAGMHFGIAKATQGATYLDPTFHKNWESIAKSGLYRGAYHF